MAATGSRLEALPELFPVFPLSGALLLPHAKLPLNIFEPRYLAMTEDALAAGRHIGLIQPRAAAGGAGPASGGPAAGAPALHRVGCIGRLVSFAETDDGRYLITLGGISRFAVAEEVATSRGYRRVRGDFAAFAEDREAPPEGMNGLDRAGLFEALRAYFGRHGMDANWPALEQMGDAAVVATLAMGCPFGPMEKQALLEAPTLADRARTLLAVLRIDMHDQRGDDAGRRPS